MLASNPDDCRFFLGSIKPIADDVGIKCEFHHDVDDHRFLSCKIQILLYPLDSEPESCVLVEEHMEAILDETNRQDPKECLFLVLLGIHHAKDGEDSGVVDESDWVWNSAGRSAEAIPDDLYYAIIVSKDPTNPLGWYSRVPTKRHIWLDPVWVERSQPLLIDEGITVN
ncbi:hypothetical protein ONZ45_g13927 [Pleurotus djamor]|nr:hypothetical protein ONZ45_g13927 [Pleurotus djamor]